ncbi:MAG: hypothetical protein JSS00_00650 [Proteobacteria bacterium]|nr:hypothetical protein [Pseudomonadota bacterium]
MQRISTLMIVMCLAILAFAHGVSSARTRPFDAHALAIEHRYAGPDGGWDFSTFDPVHRRIYISRTNSVSVLDLASAQVTQLVTGSRTHIALPINHGAEVLVTDGGSGGAFIANALTGAVRVPTIATGSRPDAAFIEPNTGLVWVLDNHDGGIAIIDTQSGRLVGRIAVQGALESPVSDGAGRVYITVEDKNEIVVIDAHALGVVAHYRLTGCESPTGLAYDARDRRLVAECANGAAKIVSARDGRELASLPLGPRPDGLINDTRRNLVFAPTAGDAMMSVIDPAGMRIVGSIATQTGARSGALDPETGIVYLPSGRFNPPATPGARPTLVAGSFEILAIRTR